MTLWLWSMLLVAAGAAPLSPCVLEGPMGARAFAECGVVDVPLDEQQPTTLVSIGFARLRSFGVGAQGLPIVLLAGGPGQAATRDFIPVLPSLSKLRQRHDIVLIDVRGTGRSKPQRCHDGRPLVARIADDDVDDALLVACAKDLTLDPRFLTTANAVRDIDAVRAAFSLERWHVLGVSYGTRLALEYDRRFNGRVATLTLDGVVAPDQPLGDDLAKDLSASLLALGNQAAVDFVAVRKQLSETTSPTTPTTFSMRHPRTAEILAVPLSARLVETAVGMLLYGGETRALLPYLLRTAAQGDLAPLLGLAVLAVTDREDAIAMPVNVSVLCAEDVPFVADNEQPEALFPDLRADLKRQCARWPRVTPQRPSFTTTSTPTLLLSGEYDPITPPRHVVRVLSNFTDAVHVVVPGHGHNVLARGCVPSIIARFLAQETTSGLDVACAADMAALAPFVDAQGPLP